VEGEQEQAEEIERKVFEQVGKEAVGTQVQTHLVTIAQEWDTAAGHSGGSGRLRLALVQGWLSRDDDEDDLEGGARTYSLGFGYGATWGCIILIFASVVLLICDRESEEIFYKERQVEEEEEEENGEA